RAVGTAPLEASHVVDEVAGRPDGVDVDDDQVALTNELVGGPAAIWARVATRGDDDVVDDLAAALEHELVDFRFDLALAHARLQPLVLDLPHRGVADAGRLLQQLDFVARLHRSGLRDRRPSVDDVQPGLLKRLERRHVEVVDPDPLLVHAVLFQRVDDAAGHPAGHVRNGAFGPLPGDGRPNAIFHPGQVDFRALQVRTSR